MKLIEPKLLKGTRDFGPAEMTKRLYVIDSMREVFASRGYQPIETPAIEYAKTILGKYGDEGDQLTYTFEDNGGRSIALRYDQTVPTARFVAANQNDLVFPFKRYQIGPVWRADKPQKGRYREFVQCDIDIIGSSSLNADAEIVSVIDTVLSKLGLKDYVIKLNSRKLLDTIMDEAGIKKLDRIDVIRIVDKMDKIGLKKVQKELSGVISKDQLKKLSETALDEKVRNRLDHLPASDAKSEMEDVMKKTAMMGVQKDKMMLDLSLARGLDYYTGTIYEVVTSDGSLGSICGGGRYDDLTGLFTSNKYPGVGIAFGLDRIVLHMEEKGLFNQMDINPSVMIVNFPDTEKENLKLLSQLHKSGVAAEMYLEDAKVNKQFKYADKKEIEWVILQGSEEIKKKKVMLRNMKTGKQKLMTMKQVLKKLAV